MTFSKSARYTFWIEDSLIQCQGGREKAREFKGGGEVNSGTRDRIGGPGYVDERPLTANDEVEISTFGPLAFVYAPSQVSPGEILRTSRKWGGRCGVRYWILEQLKEPKNDVSTILAGALNRWTHLRQGTNQCTDIARIAWT